MTLQVELAATKREVELLRTQLVELRADRDRFEDLLKLALEARQKHPWASGHPSAFAVRLRETFVRALDALQARLGGRPLKGGHEG